jgi:hypothetical protein
MEFLDRHNVEFLAGSVIVQFRLNVNLPETMETESHRVITVFHTRPRFIFNQIYWENDTFQCKKEIIHSHRDLNSESSSTDKTNL